MNREITNWFTIKELPGDVVAITEDKHEQVVSSFLIKGKDRALLFDTGLGVCNIKDVASSLYEGEILVVNSHFHFDHIGNNFRFDKVYGRVDEYSKRISEEGLSNSQIRAQFQDKCFLGEKPADFDAEKYQVKPYNLEHIEDGQIFDLGGRKLKAIYAPGHSGDSVVLYDEENKSMFTGDYFYLGGLYAFFDDPSHGVSNLDEYLQSAKRLVRECPNVKTLHPSHNGVEVDGAKLKELEEALSQVISGRKDLDLVVDEIDQYTGEKMKLGRYNFDGFGIIVKV